MEALAGAAQHNLPHDSDFPSYFVLSAIRWHLRKGAHGAGLPVVITVMIAWFGRTAKLAAVGLRTSLVGWMREKPYGETIRGQIRPQRSVTITAITDSPFSV